MNNADGGAPPGAGEASLFTNTHWSQVLLAADPIERTKAAAALEYLCRTYWYPLYAYVRRSGYSPEDAQDLTQAFFARLLEHNAFARADPTKGRFRSFLLEALKRFLITEWRKAQTAKRGGTRSFFSLVRIRSFRPMCRPAGASLRPSWKTATKDRSGIPNREEWSRISRCMTRDCTCGAWRFTLNCPSSRSIISIG